MHFAQIIAAFEASPLRGLPIGNLTSQYFANHYLTDLDHFVKERLQIRAYIRYMDDMVLWSRDKATLLEGLEKIRVYVEDNLFCALKPVLLNRTTCGLPFLGYHIFPYHVRLLQKSKQRFLKKMRQVHKSYNADEWSEGSCQRRAMALLAFAQHADANTLQKNLFLRLQGQSS